MRVYIIFVFLFLSCIIISQDVTYRVFFFNGEVSFKGYQEKSWNILNDVNIMLTPNDSINLEKGSELFLFDNNAAQYYFSLPGKNKISTLTDSINLLERESLISKYADFIWKELNKPHADLDDYAEKHMREKGGVSRAVNIPVIYEPFYGTYIIDDKLEFKWENTGVDKYTLSFWDSDKNGRCFFSVAIEDTFALVPTDLPWMPEDGILYYYSITEKNKPSTNFIPVKVLNKEEKENILVSLDQIMHNPNIKGWSRDLIIASLYEENNLLINANQIYLEILENNPNNTAIQKYYNLFLARNQDGARL